MDERHHVLSEAQRPDCPPDASGCREHLPGAHRDFKVAAAVAGVNSSRPWRWPGAGTSVRGDFQLGIAMASCLANSQPKRCAQTKSGAEVWRQMKRQSRQRQAQSVARSKTCIPYAPRSGDQDAGAGRLSHSKRGAAVHLGAQHLVFAAQTVTPTFPERPAARKWCGLKETTSMV